MDAIIIHGTGKKNARLIYNLVKRLGGQASGLTNEQYEDIMLGLYMEKVKSGENVPREAIFEKLK